MEIPENILKEIKLSFTTKTAYEKDSVDAYIQELFMQIEDAKRATDFKQKELSEYKKKVKELEEARLLEGSPSDQLDELIAERDAAKNALIGAREQLSDMEDKLQEANEKILELTEECEKYDEALAKYQADADAAAGQAPDSEENAKLREVLNVAQGQIAALTAAKVETEARLAVANRELTAMKEQLAKQPSSAPGEEKPASNNMMDLFAEAQTFMNAAKEKAAALTSDAQQQAAKIIQDAEEEARKIRAAGQTEMPVQQIKTGEISAIERNLADIRAAIAKKLDEAVAIAAQEAAKLTAGQEQH